MILVTRLNGDGFALNPDLVERADATPDTVVTLVDGTKYIILESVPELVELVRDYRASVIAAAGALDDARRSQTGAHPMPGNTHPVARATTTHGEHTGAVVALHRREH
ncbi:MAG TPA: flagellar FlbD family protein [Mycobacteriales bacterium]|nr:flagellar FlbD family protein [Mycobacteriales bacterium]